MDRRARNTRRVGLIAVLVAAVAAPAALAEAANSVVISAAYHSRVGRHLTVTFSGRDSAPSNVNGTYLAAVLEPPLRHGGSRCKANLGDTEQNHPRSKQLFFQKLTDTHHTGHYRVSKRMPAFTWTGRWTVCAWQFNNDGSTSTDSPASHAQVHILVRPRLSS